MRKAHKVILKALSQKPLTKEELVEQTGYSYDGIRGRISEMRKLGYDIDYELVEEKRYILKHQSKQKLIKFLDEHNLYGREINIDVVGKRIQLNMEEMTTAVSKLFADPLYDVTQMSNTKIIVRKLNS